MNKTKLIFGLFVLLFSLNSTAQDSKGTVYVDENGVMRWSGGEEVKGFGVNYSVPFAHAYRSAEKKGLDIKAEMDKDIYHFTRLGFDLYRLHVWDTEISDEQGNLLENEHLEAFDYLLSQLKDRDINFVITPIAYWGNGWPEPDEDTPGFSDKYGKEKSLTDPEAIKAQQNYLAQFLEHVNPYTGVAYKNEPNIIAFEVSNEPHHRGEPEEVKEFINKMVSAMRSTGSEKPIFYNVSHSVHLAETYFDSNIQGGTFQWYPTGLGFQKELEGNLLPNVNDYNIPFDEVIQASGKAKLVYEFDAADVNKSYMYPAMARSFREAGIQIATHFAYDPTFLAYANTEYNTHYMNLNYTPHKALALMIASKIFHEVELGKDLGTYPENLEFGNFKISYEGDIATYASEDEFIYTNSSNQQAENISELKSLSGHGSSTVVDYNGKGAYFLDKLEDGAWRLEVMPDPVLIKNPFGSNSLEKTVSVISWKENEMKLDLPDLGTDFSIQALNDGNEYNSEAENSKFRISPGTYLLSAKGTEIDLAKAGKNLRVPLNAFEAQSSTVDETYLVHDPVSVAPAGQTFDLELSAVSKSEIEKIEAWFRNGNVYESVELKAENNYDYSVEVPAKLLEPGFLEYRIIVKTKAGDHTFPGAYDGSPADWDFYGEELYSTRIVQEDSPVYLFHAENDHENLVRPWTPGNKLVPTGENSAEYHVKIDELFEEDVENLGAEPVYDYSFRYNFRKKLGNRTINSKNKLVLKARSPGNTTKKMQVALVMDNGAAFGKIVELGPELKEIEIDPTDLQPVKTVTLPRPYPGFLPYYFDHEYSGDLELEKVESVQFSIGPGMTAQELKQPHEVAIESLRIE
ncbi:cellulase family glycosylhydrolase [Gramella sp. GC03-9]|uniref:Cellulase family glycosylhydrolase n=1 Tax=Christiangramia oceanisediminis TaxID=2920386 RepID=A0A9X2KZB1_9FLAO|nr:cellulase family glycosylhydrolase [Gramella oceanisediminis]MCP9200961.1 cellulase family glycosylhydrolase [Gramella oceanisediminis]